VGKPLKSRIASIALIGLPALFDVGLIAFRNADIAKSWPLGDWPGTEWQINLPAVLFWVCLIWLALSIYFRCIKSPKALLIVLVWISIIGLAVFVWNNALIARPWLFYFALIGLLLLSAAFSSAETAFTILQEDVTKVLEDRASGRDPDATTKVQERRGKKGKPSKFFNSRYNLVDNNIGESEFQTLLSFLLVVANLTNLGGMSLIGKSLKSGDSSNAFSLVISSVIVVIVGEIFAKFVARRLPVRTASATVVLIAPLKWLMGWYTNCLMVPFKWLLDRKWVLDRAP